MKKYGKVRGTSQPDAILIDELSVWVSENPVSVEVHDEHGTRIEWEYDLTQYDKDEYIHMMSNHAELMENQLNDTMMALCDVYEMIATVM